MPVESSLRCGRSIGATGLVVGEKMTRIITFLALLLVGSFLVAAPASAGVVAKVDIRSQRMTVIVDGDVIAVWKVSTGRKGFHTPRGVFRPQALKRMHYSKKYDNAPMPHAVFFRGGYAVHGTNAYGALGRPASHGCVRLSKSNAAALFQLINQYGARNARIVIT